MAMPFDPGDTAPRDRSDLVATWDVLERARPRMPAGAPSSDEAWQEIAHRLHLPILVDRRPARSARRRVTFSVGAGAMLVALLFGWWMWQRPVVVTAPDGSVVTVTLPEGSSIQLNSGGSIAYRRRFESIPFIKSRREVSLQGEAYFDVSHVDGRPFEVATSDARVFVVGTRFNIRAWNTPEEHETVVTVASGRVRVAPLNDATRSVVLAAPGESVSIASSADSTLKRRTLTLDHVLAWRSNAFSAIDQPAVAILADLARRYDVDIQVTGGLVLDDPMTLFYGSGTPAEHILHDICLVESCVYRPTNRGFTLAPKS